MFYTFTQAVHLAGKDYARGTHEVPEKAEMHPHFLKFVKAGFIVEADVKEAVTLKTAESKRAETLNRVIAKQNARRQAKALKSDGVVSKVDEKGAPAEVTLNDGTVAEVPKDVAPIEPPKPEEKKEDEKKGKGKK